MRQMANKAASLNQPRALGNHAFNIARSRGARAKAIILKRCGRLLTAKKVAAAQCITVLTVRRRVKARKLIGFGSERDPTKLLLPAMQFARDGKVYDWVKPLIEAYGDNGIGLVGFLVAPRTNLDGATYLQAIQDHQTDRVMAAAMRTNPH